MRSASLATAAATGLFAAGVMGVGLVGVAPLPGTSRAPSAPPAPPEVHGPVTWVVTASDPSAPGVTPETSSSLPAGTVPAPRLASPPPCAVAQIAPTELDARVAMGDAVVAYSLHQAGDSACSLAAALPAVAARLAGGSAVTSMVVAAPAPAVPTPAAPAGSFAPGSAAQLTIQLSSVVGSVARPVTAPSWLPSPALPVPPAVPPVTAPPVTAPPVTAPPVTAPAVPSLPPATAPGVPAPAVTAPKPTVPAAPAPTVPAAPRVTAPAPAVPPAPAVTVPAAPHVAVPALPAAPTPTTNPPPRHTAPRTAPPPPPPGAGAPGPRAYPSGSTGYDISWPQCGQSFPPSPYTVAVVGINDGRAFTDNPCLDTEAQWAGGQRQVYLNINSPTADDGSDLSGPAGSCSGGANEGCVAYNYGYNTAVSSMTYAAQHGAAARMVWLDVETAGGCSSAFPTGGSGYWSCNGALNADTIQGAVDALSRQGYIPGVYSTSYQWGVITGGYTVTGPAIDTWLAGAPADRSWCNGHGFAGGNARLLQVYPSDTWDRDLAC